MLYVDGGDNAVGIGTATTTSYSSHINIFLGGTGNIYADTAVSADASLSISQNAYVDSDGSWEYRVTDEATNYYQNAGNHVWRYAGSGAADADISWSEAMRIDSSGNVGIGTNDPSGAFLHVTGTSTGLSGDFTNTNTSGYGLRVTTYGTGAQYGLAVDSYGGGYTRDFTVGADGDVNVLTGNLVIGTAGKGIWFETNPNAAGMTSELLDDYEEGTWTPTILDLAGNLATLSTANGSYTKIGRWIQINFQIVLSSKGSMTGDYVLMGGIPFNHPTEPYNGTGVIDSWGNFATSYSGLWFDTGSTASRMWLTAVAAAGATSYVMPTVAALNDTSHLKGSCMYQISV